MSSSEDHAPEGELEKPSALVPRDGVPSHGSMPNGPGREEVVEVEAERLPPRGSTGPRINLVERFREAAAPVVAGMVLDVADFATFHPAIGIPIGLVCGSQLIRHLDMPPAKRLWALVGCGAYCALPLTNALPLATLLGAISRFYPQKTK
ncbi:MAG: hypothetical protein AB8H79_14430 [Myxococcota bacterium]